MRMSLGGRTNGRGMRTLGRRVPIAVVVLFVIGAPPTAAQTSIMLSADNDYFNFWQAPHRRSDVDYTQGVALTVRWPGRVPHALRWIGSGSPCEAATPAHTACTRFGVMLGQQIYTPWYDTAVLLPGDRPYAGWLYVTGEVRRESRTALDAFALTVGVTGGPSLAEPVQTQFHRWFGFREPQGWEHQLPFEPGVQLGLDGARRLLNVGRDSGLGIGLTPTWRAMLGTVTVAGTVGGVAMIGWRLPPAWPGPRGDGLAGVGVYAKVGVEGTLVARDLFLDGTVLTRSARVDKRTATGEAVLGIGVRAHRLLLEWLVHKRTRAYHTQPVPHTYSSLTVVLR
jgi:lipid A 3-O-deacylase